MQLSYSELQYFIKSIKRFPRISRPFPAVNFFYTPCSVVIGQTKIKALNALTLDRSPLRLLELNLKKLFLHEWGSSPVVSIEIGILNEKVFKRLKSRLLNDSCAWEEVLNYAQGV